MAEISEFHFSIASWAAWSPQAHCKAAWKELASGDRNLVRSESPNVADVPMLMRRRLGHLGRMALRCAIDAGKGCKQPNLVFSSRYGDSSITPVLINDIVGDAPLSPAKFSTSVHNAIAGLFSILTKNTAPHTAISAGADSLAYGLLEAVAQLLEDQRPVLWVHYDTSPDDFFKGYVEDEAEDASLAVLLTLPSDDCEVVVMAPSGDEVSEASGCDVVSFVHFLVGHSSSWRHEFANQQWECRRGVA